MTHNNSIEQLEFLDWDTDFFKRKICRIHGALHIAGEKAAILRELEENEIELAYYSSPFELSSSLDVGDAYSIQLVDKKVTYVKAIDPLLRGNEKVVRYEDSYMDQKLLDLAIESGVYSRFKFDSKIGQHKFEELYKKWIIHSVDKKLAKEVLVYVEEKEIIGFVTLGEKDLRGDIGIIAVDAAFRGKGIGKSLMHSAENWFAENTGFQQLQVVTQLDNVPSCSLYQSCGFQIDQLEYFYHLWKN